ncbi:MAG: MFS transporter [Lachnospiraceae bacterium]|nr:MFS transporter [Lachnospiraceae bacterium]
MKKNKWLNGLLPMFLINFAIGNVYCWTLVKEHVNAYAGFDRWVLEWCFSLAIFFLGMSAAFGGKIVEKAPKKSAFLTFIFFSTGWLLTALGIHIKNPWIMVLGFGVVQGIGLGFGYITPVKTMMVWFEGKKGLAAGLSIASFGIAGVIANPIIGALLESGLQVYTVFYILAGLYGIALFIASRLLYRPEIIEPAGTVHLKAREVIFHGKFILLWLIIFLNITCGLAMISQEKQVYNIIGISSMAVVVLFCSINAISNVAGRLALASWQDKLKRKHIPYYMMAIFSLAAGFIAALVYRFNNVPKPYIPFLNDEGVQVGMRSLSQEIAIITFISVALIFVVQFFFGVGFGCLPNILHQNYGLHQLSTVHGFSLSAWGIAGLVGNQVSSYIITNYDLTTLFTTIGVLYSIMLVLLVFWARIVKKEKQFA